MEVDESDSGIEDNSNGHLMAERMVDFVSKSKKAFFKSQQIGEPELTIQQKRDILEETLNKSHSTFLSRYGNELTTDHLGFFENRDYSDEEKFEVTFYLNQIRQNNSNSSRTKNRRYAALQKMIQENDEHFSEQSLMAREPLLYNQLVGQYLSEDDKRARDTDENDTFVDIMFRNIDQDRLRSNLQEQQQDEDLDEDDKVEERFDKLQVEDDVASSSRKLWGNFEDDNIASGQDGMCQRNFNANAQAAMQPVQPQISEQDQEFLRDEFMGIMYSNFLSGQDGDFDYETVDLNPDFDDLIQENQDAEDKYFDTEDMDDSEQTESQPVAQGSDEDELDVFMKHLKNCIQGGPPQLE